MNILLNQTDSVFVECYEICIHYFCKKKLEVFWNTLIFILSLKLNKIFYVKLEKKKYQNFSALLVFVFWFSLL